MPQIGRKKEQNMAKRGDIDNRFDSEMISLKNASYYLEI